MEGRRGLPNLDSIKFIDYNIFQKAFPCKNFKGQNHGALLCRTKTGHTSLTRRPHWESTWGNSSGSSTTSSSMTSKSKQSMRMTIRFSEARSSDKDYKLFGDLSKLVGGEVGELNTLACSSKTSRAAIVFTSNWGELLYVIVYIQLGGSGSLWGKPLF